MQFPSGNDWTPSIDPRDYSQQPLTIIEESIKRKQKQTAAPPPTLTQDAHRGDHDQLEPLSNEDWKRIDTSLAKHMHKHKSSEGGSKKKSKKYKKRKSKKIRKSRNRRFPHKRRRKSIKRR